MLVCCLVRSNHPAPTLKRCSSVQGRHDCADVAGFQITGPWVKDKSFVDLLLSVRCESELVFWQQQYIPNSGELRPALGIKQEAIIRWNIVSLAQ